MSFSDKPTDATYVARAPGADGREAGTPSKRRSACLRGISHSPPWLFFAVKYLWPSTVPLFLPFGRLSRTPILGSFFLWCKPTNLTTPVPYSKWYDFGRASALNQHQQYMLGNSRGCVVVWLCVSVTTLLRAAQAHQNRKGPWLTLPSTSTRSPTSISPRTTSR